MGLPITLKGGFNYGGANAVEGRISENRHSSDN